MYKLHSNFSRCVNLNNRPVAALFACQMGILALWPPLPKNYKTAQYELEKFFSTLTRFWEKGVKALLFSGKTFDFLSRCILMGKFLCIIIQTGSSHEGINFSTVCQNFSEDTRASLPPPTHSARVLILEQSYTVEKNKILQDDYTLRKNLIIILDDSSFDNVIIL